MTRPRLACGRSRIVPPLTAIFLAAREPRGRAQAAAASPAGAANAGTGPAHVVPAPVTGEGEPARPADGGIAA